jgi:hypothetical protein
VSQQLAPPETQQIIDVSQDKKDNSLWLKVFLIDSTLNQNSWKLKDEYIKKNVQNFIGKPFILTSDKKHPDFVKEGVVFGKGQETLDQILTAQSKYKIGEIKQVDSNGNQYFAYVQIDNPRIIDSFKQGNIPKFVSPAIYDPTGEPDGTKVKDFTPIHVAAVDEPAFGLKAYTRGSCEGEATKCLNELKSANDKTAGAPKDPNCPCSILETFSNKFNSESSSYLKNASLQQDSLSQLEKPDTIIAEITPQVETSKLEQATSDTNPTPSTPSQAPQQPLQQSEENRKINEVPLEEAPKAETRGRKAALEGELESVKQQLAQVLEWQKGEQEKAVKAAAEQQRATIEAAITPQVVGGDEAKRAQVIDNLVGLNFSNEQLQFVLDLIGNKQGPPKEEQSGKKQPPQFGNNQVKQASVNTLVLNQKQNAPKVNTSYVGFFGDL